MFRLQSLAVFVLAVFLAAPLLAQRVSPSWSGAAHWDDGLAEIAFYEVERQRDPYGRDKNQTFQVGTYLVKHDFDRAAESKAGSGSESAVEAFKWALFYELESGALQYKRSYVTNVARRDLEPLKSSFVSFDWCSNLYRELSFASDGSVRSLKRSDDYGNREETFRPPAGAVPWTELPLFVRGLELAAGGVTFPVLTHDGTHVEARAELAGRQSVETRAGSFETEKVVVYYAGAVPSLVGERADEEEHYFRGTGAARILVELRAASGRYRMSLVETLRSAYWRENFFPRLKRVEARP